MRQFLSELKHNQNIFVGDYDSYTIISRQSSLNDLMSITKMALLLFDHILMPAAFFWQSSEMTHLMAYLEEPIACGLILPVIRDYDSTTDIYDYFERRVDESQKIGNIEVFKQPDLASEIASKSHIKSVKHLEHMNSYAHLDGTSVRNIFTSNWITDLTNHDDINSIRLLLCQSRLSKTKLQQVLATLLDEAHYPQFSRASCIERVQKIVPPGNIQNLIKSRISWLYLKSNATSYGSKFYYTYDPYNRMLFEENLFLLAQTLEVFGITKKLISELTISEILQIRSSPEFHLFISTYRKLVNASYCKQSDIVDRLKKKFVWEMRKEKMAFAIYKKLCFLQSTSVPIFLGLIVNHFSNSEISDPVLIATGVMSTVPSIIKRFNSLNQCIKGKPFSDFKEYIIAEQYKKYYQKHLGE